MKQRSIVALTLMIALLLAASCGSSIDLVKPDPRFVIEHSAGMLSRYATIKIAFVEAYGEGRPEKIDANPFFIFPATKGEARWLDDRTLEFVPTESLKPGARYVASVDMRKIGEARGEPRYDFAFSVLRSDYSVSVGSLSCDPEKPLDAFELSGEIETIDFEDSGAIERVLEVEGARSFEWRHDSTSKRHTFIAKGLERGAAPKAIPVRWSGAPLGNASSGIRSVLLPAAGSFELMDARAVVGDERFVELAFSEPLKAGQDFRGLVSIEGLGELKYDRDGSKLRVYGSLPMPASFKVEVAPGIESATGKTLAQSTSRTLSGQDELPQVRFAGSGVIVPTTQGVIVPFETMNLTGVVVEAFKVYGDNMLQFLQVNELTGTKEMYRVGAPVWKKSFDLPLDASKKNVWQRHALDFSELVKKHPDGMFQLRAYFTRPQIDYVCPKSHKDFSGLEFPEPVTGDAGQGESSYWDYWEDYGYYDDSGNYYSTWQLRMDPCHPSYYKNIGGHDIVARRNVLVSNIGLIAKAEQKGRIHVFASDIRNAMPLAKAQVSAYDFQRRKLGQAVTDSAGMATLDLFERPFALIAEAAGQHGYLKMAEGLALSMSLFDVNGEAVDDGVKGFIYGERGVWRPGDDIYLTFVLLDREARLPAKYPVTFELEDPQGRITEKRVVPEGLNGFYAIKTSTKADAPTGSWTARVLAAGKKFARSLKVESVMPNRLKIDLSFGSASWLGSQSVKANLSSRWLHGAPASGLRAETKVYYSFSGTRFPAYSAYDFDDPTRPFTPSVQTLFSEYLDAEGKASFEVKANAGDSAPGKLSALISTRVFENEGVYSSEAFSIDFHPYFRYVGIKAPAGDAARGMLLTDVDHPLDIVLVDRDGKPAPDAQLDAELFKIRWRWWWEKGSEDLTEYSRGASMTRIMSGTVKTSGGRATWNFRVAYPDWGRYLLRVRDPATGHSAAKIVYIDWPGWAGRAQGGEGGAANILSLTSIKPSYVVGEKIQVSFPSSDKGVALVTIEAGGKLIRKQWVRGQAGSTRYVFDAEAAMAPNCYVHVHYLQEHLQTQNDLPIRLYGVVPVQVTNPGLTLAPMLETPAKIAPGTTVSFKVREASGKPMTYTVAVVDEGLLGITRHKTENPADRFNAKEASLLKTWDIYQYVAGAFSGKLETQLGVGGSDSGDDSASKKPNRFKPVVHFIGPVVLAKNGVNTHTFTMPEYVGEVRFMVVAGSGEAFGVAEKSVTVASDLMSLATLPRVLSPGESIRMPVNVFSYKAGRQSVAVSASVCGAAKIKGATSQTLVFQQPGDQVAYFELEAGAAAGIAQIKIACVNTAAGARSEQTIEIGVRSLSAPAFETLSGVVGAGKSVEATLKLPGIEGSNSATLEFSRMPPLDLGRRLEFLIQYPYGCIEQTTSAAFPQLYLEKLAAMSADERDRARKNIASGIERLKSFVAPTGGFAYWPGETEASAWGTSYAGHFLLEAARMGYHVPEELLSPWREYQKRSARLWTGSSEGDMSDQAYRLYTMALDGKPDIAAMNRLKDKAGLGTQARWRLAAAYARAGMRSQAQELAKGLGSSVDEYRELGGSFGSALRDKAMVLEALGEVGMDSMRAELAAELAKALSDGSRWLSTQETAYSLIALLPYYSSEARGAPISYSYSLGSFQAKDASLEGPLAKASFALPGSGSLSFKLANSGSAPLHYRVVARGTQKPGTEKAQSDGVALSVFYNSAEAGPASYTQGDDILVEAWVQNLLPKKLENLCLDLPFPSIWEIKNERLFGSDGGSSSYDYMDIRDDKVAVFFSLKEGESKTFKFWANKAYVGTSWLPAARCFAMYDESVSSVVPGRWMEFVEGGR